MKNIIKKCNNKIAWLTYLLLMSGAPVFAQDSLENPIKYETIEEFLTVLTNFLIQFGLALILLMVVLGGFYIMISGGDPEKLEKGKNIIKWTLLGVFLVLLSRAILALVFYVVG